MTKRVRVSRWVIFVVLIVGFLPGRAAEEEKTPITVEWIYSEEGKHVASVPSFVWLDDGTLMLLDPRRPKIDRTLERFDPETGERSPLLDPERVRQEFRVLLEEPRDEKEDPEDDPREVFQWPEAISGDGRWGLFSFENDLFLIDISTAELRRITKTAAEEKSARFAPDCNHFAFVRDNDVFVYDIEARDEKQLTFDGSETCLNGTLSWVYWEEIFGREDLGYWWSPDSTAIAYLQTDESGVGVAHYVDFEPNLPRVVRQRYPKAGQANPRVRAGIVALESAQTTWVDLGVYPYEYLVRIVWRPEGRGLSVQTLNREQTKLDLFLVDGSSGEVKHLLRETDPAWVNIHDDLHFLKEREEFLWVSERDGYSHIYRGGLNGQPLTRITRGDWALRSSGSGPFWLRRSIVAVDEQNDWIYFTALKESSTENHLYRIRFDGNSLERITSEPGTHRINFRCDAKLYVDVYSNIEALPAMRVAGNSGKLLATLAAARPELLAKFDMKYPEIFTIPAEDGFRLPAQLLKPKSFDPQRKHPVILYVYGGPSAPTVSNSWQGSLFFDQMLLDRGYLVMRVDNRSATAISKKLENIIKLEGYGPHELQDLVAAVRWLKAQPFVDSDRVGIWGWSGGGTFTLLALTGCQEFRAGISVAPVTDWHFYDTKWAEAFMKRPRDNEEGYERTSLVKKAGNLHGRLLLVHGTYDDNVHPQNTWSFADALVEAGKLFEMMIYPMRKHGISDDAARIHLYKTMLEFWERNL